MQQRISNWLDRPDVAYALGAPGAIAEFRRHEDDPPARRQDLSVCSARGAIRITPRRGARVSTERVPRQGHDAGGSFLRHCLTLPCAVAGQAARTTITALGIDHEAVQPHHLDQQLFDLGLGLPHVDACVRSADARLVAALADCEGASLLDPGCPAMGLIKAASPHRVFISVLARIEVYQRIPSGARGERTPSGPHTHVRPALLERARRARPVVLEIFEPSS